VRRAELTDLLHTWSPMPAPERVEPAGATAPAE
jgi:hypothetical protein